jgi:hypothetical protein
MSMSTKRSIPTFLPTGRWLFWCACLFAALALGDVGHSQQSIAPPSGLITWWAGEGDASDMERNHNGVLENGASFAPDVEFDLGTGGSIGTATFVAANGDSFSTTIIGQGTPTPDPTIAMIEEVETITGGTGRFASVTGSFMLERLVSRVTGVSSGSFSGTILNPGRR